MPLSGCKQHLLMTSGDAVPYWLWQFTIWPYRHGM